MKSVLPQCSELILLNQAIQALATSRLNAGALYLPDGLSASTAPPTAETDDTYAAEEDEFENALIDAMTTPIRDPSSASSVVPLIIRGPADLSQAIRQFSFERTFDEALVNRCDKVMDRILSGLDIPKDVVSGLSGVRYSNALVIEDSLLKSHIEPLIELICQSLTTTFLHPYLHSRGYTPEQAARVVMAYDPSPIVNRPNRAQDAQALYNNYELSGSALRRANGFADTDAPKPDELVRRLATQKGQMTPELFESILRVVAPKFMEKAAGAAPGDSALPPELSEALGVAPAEQASDTAETETEIETGPATGLPTGPPPEGNVVSADIPQGGQMPPREAV
jgi:hypothetical protein